ncbi:hypothetical protein M0804_013252 [Polistes exclamans]|nr:hypothetical protein M0804_013252 [Polistes exclamans]
MYEDDDAMKYYVSKADTMLEKYNGDGSVFSTWIKKFEGIVDYLGIPDSKKITFLCLMLETDIFHALSNDLSPQNIYNVSYLDLLYELNTFNMMTTRKLLRKNFRERIQRDNETAEDYAKSLFQQFHKSFNKEHANLLLCQQFIKGLRDRVIATYLSRKQNATFKMIATKAIELEKRYNAPANG